MLCANTMWRSKLIILFLLITQSAFAQKEEDSLFFVRYAYTMDLLLPNDTGLIRYTDFARDSLTFQKAASGKTLKTSSSLIQYNEKDTEVYTGGKFILSFDHNARVKSLRFFNADSAWQYSRELNYRIASKLEFTVYNSGKRENDTIVYRYDRAGNLAGVCIRQHHDGEDSISCDQRLYNNKGQLVVMQQSHYGTITGTFTYEYDESGRLVRRQFLNRANGAVLCTDTIAYGFMDMQNRYYFQKHSIRISGFDQWIPIDEIQYDTQLKKRARYEFYNGTYSSRYSLSGPGSVEYTYTEDGRLKSRRKKEKDIELLSEYSIHETADTIRTYRIHQDEHSFQRVLQTETVLDYNAAGLIVQKRIWSYAIERKKKIWRNRQISLTTVIYNWG